MKTELIICQGLPGSGKSTFAIQRVCNGHGPNRWVRINRTLLRQMLHAEDRIPTPNRHDRVVVTLAVRDLAIRGALEQGFSVVCDDPNLDPQDVKELARVAELAGAEVTVRTFPLSLEEALYRNERAMHPLPAHVIVEMARKAAMPKPIRPERPWVERAPAAIICDVSGTLRRGGVLNEPIMHVVTGVMRLWKETPHGIQLVFFVETADIEWAEANIFTPFERLDSDFYYLGIHERSSEAAQKRAHFDARIEGRYNVVLVLDDKDRPVRMWRELGLPVCQIAEGE